MCRNKYDPLLGVNSMHFVQKRQVKPHRRVYIKTYELRDVSCGCKTWSLPQRIMSEGLENK
jgi:hypothetical protein